MQHETKLEDIYHSVDQQPTHRYPSKQYYFVILAQFLSKYQNLHIFDYTNIVYGSRKTKFFILYFGSSTITNEDPEDYSVFLFCISYFVQPYGLTLGRSLCAPVFGKVGIGFQLNFRPTQGFPIFSISDSVSIGFSDDFPIETLSEIENWKFN